MNDEFLVFNTRDELLRIDIRTLVYFEASGNYTEIVSANGSRELIGMSLARMEKALAMRAPGSRYVFARLGKRHIVNLAFVRRISPLRQQLKLGDGATFELKLNISKEALKRLKEFYK